MTGFDTPCYPDYTKDCSCLEYLRWILGQIDGAICFTRDDQLFNVVRSLIKAKGLSVIIRVKTASETTSLMKRNPKKILVLDWAVGPKDGIKILSAPAESDKIEMRPSLLVSSRHMPSLMGTAADYDVTSVYMGKFAEDDMRQAVERLFTDFIPPDMAKIFAEVTAARQSDQWEKASRLLDALEEQYPNDPRVIIEVVENHLYFDEVDDAIMYLVPLVSEENVHVRIINSYSRALMKAGRYEEAALVMRRANIINPYNVERLIGLGKAFLNMDWADQAMENFDSALKLDEDNPEAIAGKSQVLAVQGDVNEAMALMQKSGSARETSSVFNSSAIMAIRKGKFDEGMELYQLAAKAAGEDKSTMARVAFNIGIGYHRWEKPEKALYYFSLATQLDPKYKKALRNAKIVEGLMQGGKKIEFSGDIMKDFEKGASFEPVGLEKVEDMTDDIFDTQFEDERF